MKSAIYRFYTVFRRYRLFTGFLKAFTCAYQHFFQISKLVKLENSGDGFWIRTATSDIYSFSQCLNVEDENLSRWEIPYFLIRERINPQYILDLGSNIGGSVFFYEHKFPSAQIYACEPLESNFEVLNKNVSNKNTKSLKVGIGDKPGFAAFQIPQKSNYWEATKTEVTQTHESVPILTVEEILNRFEIPKVDILKISIEGDEGLVLLSIEDWSKFDIICISIRTNKNPVSLGQVSEALSNRGYGYVFSLVGSVVWSYPTQYLRE